MPSAESVELSGIHTSIRIRRPAAAVVVVEIQGRDTGELGDAPFRELARDLDGPRRPELFIDARDAPGASVDVSGVWAAWLGANRARYLRVNMLTGSRFVTITAEFVRRFAELGEQMRIFTDPREFGDALTVACALAPRPGATPP